ncbi:unnamed protein product [Closterium sp. NIES-64]|nr:unnamed protein product [Closterium sp. NIES-64]
MAGTAVSTAAGGLGAPSQAVSSYAAASQASPSYAAAPSQVPLPPSPSSALAASPGAVDRVFSGRADSSRADASWADFSRADFSRAAFSRADFSRADASEPTRFALPRELPVPGSEAVAAAGRFRSPEEFMRRQLTAMAEAVENRDMAQVQQAYLQLKPLARPKGTAMERLIHYMVEGREGGMGLFKRVQGTGYQHFSTPNFPSSSPPLQAQLQQAYLQLKPLARPKGTAMERLIHYMVEGREEWEGLFKRTTAAGILATQTSCTAQGDGYGEIDSLYGGGVAQVQQAYLQLKPLARPKGTAMERLIHYMVEGLFKRLQGNGYQHFNTPVRKTPKNRGTLQERNMGMFLSCTSPSLSPFLPSPSLSPFLPSPSLSPFLPSPSLSPFLPSPSLSPFLPSPSLSPFLPSPSLSPFLPSPSLSPFLPSPSLSPFLPSPSLSPFLPSPSLSPFLPSLPFLPSYPPLPNNGHVLYAVSSASHVHLIDFEELLPFHVLFLPLHRSPSLSTPFHRLPPIFTSLHASPPLPFQELDEARAWFATSTPYPAFGNMAITGMFLHAVSSASHVHLIDFGELLPFHLPTIMELFAARPGGPPHLRVTGLDTTTFVCPGRKDFKSLRAVAEVGRRLRGMAMRLGVPFEFEYIDIDENQLHLLYQVKRRWSETLVVCAHLELMNFPDDSVVDHGPRDCILRWIHDLKPALFTFVEMDLDSNARPFLSRFQHILDHHLSVFCSHDALIGAADKRLLSIFEELYFGRTIVNIVSCEGVERVHRPETLDQWRGRMLRLGRTPCVSNPIKLARRGGMELEEAARERKERLRALREAASIVTTDGEKTASLLADGDDGKENEPVAEVRFRSYLPRDDQLMERKLPPAQLPKFQEPTAAQPLFLDPNEDPVTAIAPRKPNWDLRRDVAKRLAKLERRTQRAMVELMREEEERRQQQESGIEGS